MAFRLRERPLIRWIQAYRSIGQAVNTMANFAPPAVGQTTLPTTYRTSLAPVIAATRQ